MVIERLCVGCIFLSDVDRVNNLLCQLSSRATVISYDRLCEIAKKNVIFVARDENKMIVGMATLIFVTKMMGDEGLVEDVVVDVHFRGRGIGEDLMGRLIEYARAMKVESINLTSRSTRIEANGLYQKLGFELRKTNVYRLTC